MNFLLNIMPPDADYAAGEALLPALAVVLQGMATVFAVLCIIWLCLAIMRVFMYDLPKRRAEEEASTPAPVAQAAPAPAVTAPVANDGELVAVITAAIAAARAGSCEGKFRVVSFKRKNK